METFDDLEFEATFYFDEGIKIVRLVGNFLISCSLDYLIYQYVCACHPQTFYRSVEIKYKGKIILTKDLRHGVNFSQPVKVINQS
jgi:hypothetical protein